MTPEGLIQIVQVVVFLGLVILVHELGHFLAARWCGVLVERFSIGFGPILLAVRRGETEYALSAIPLGGYVKMLGQSDTPTVEEYSGDPRSYQNKSVLQRMFIISAGVIMNVIFGVVCFAVVFTIGLPYQPATIGTVSPGSPAWKAGLAPGDRIVEVAGIKNPWYDALVYQVMFTNPAKRALDLTVDRGGKRVDFHLRPEYASKHDDKPIIGVLQSLDLNLVDEPKIPPTDPNSKARAAQSPAFEPGDRVVAVDGVSVSTYQEFDRLMFERRREPVSITVERKGNPKEGARVRETIRVEPAFVRTLGLTMTMGEIKAVREGSPADRAVDAEGKAKPIRATDRILAMDGRTDFDPMRLPDLLADKAGERVELTLRRQSRTPEEVKVYVVPDATPTWLDVRHPPAPTSTLASIPSLGIAYDVLNIVQSVDPDGPAAKAAPAVKAGDVVKEVDFVLDTSDRPPSSSWNPFGRKSGNGETTLRYICSENSWPGVFWGMQSPEILRVKLKMERSGAADGSKDFTVDMTPVEDPTWPLHLRGVRFLLISGIQRGDGVLQAILIGFDYTKVTMQRIYLTLSGLVTRQIKPTLLSGPLQLANVAYHAADDWRIFLLLIGLININLAVINFLPIPVLDGGHMVFLLYEGVTRRRPNERVVFVGHVLGFFFIIFLMLSVISLDVWKLFLEQAKL